MWFLLACSPAEPAPPPPAAIAEGVRARLGDPGDGGWLAAAGAVSLAAPVARAAEVTLKGGPEALEIRAGRSEWDLQAHRARFTEDVSIRRGELVIRCGLLEVRYRDTEHIDRVIATEGVELTGAGRRATAARAEIVGETGEVRLTGTPTLSEGPNSLMGEVITLFLDDHRAVCEGVAGAPCRLVVDGSALR